MVDWNIVKNDLRLRDPLDPEIVPLCDALNAAGFITSGSCCGHGSERPYVQFNHNIDTHVENLARFVRGREDYKLYRSAWEKEILPDGHLWCVALIINNVYTTTSPSIALKMAIPCINKVAQEVNEWHKAFWRCK